MKKGKSYKIGVILCIIVLLIGIFIYWQNNSIEINKIQYKNSKVPVEFNGYTIAHISDLHNKEFGKNQDKLIEKLKATSPDIIVITGDLVDRRKYNLENAMEFIEGAVNIAPVYYVTGNHEAWSGKEKDIKDSLLKAGINIMDDSKKEIIEGNDKINIIGVADPDFYTGNYIEGTDSSNLKETLEGLADESVFTILLCHRPELIDIYAKENIDIVFTGHAHGGQFRLPLLGGLIAPDQGLFPKYTSGAYTLGNTTEIVSRGLGNSIVPVRIFNRPEIVVVTMNNK